MNIKIKNPFAKQMGTVATLCMLALMFLGFGCKTDEMPPKTDEEAYLKILNQRRENLPEWLNERIDVLIKFYGEEHKWGTAKIFQGEWNKRTVYYIVDPLSSCGFCEIFFENGEKVEFKTPGSFDIFKPETFLLGSKNWIIIFQIVDGVLGQ